MAYEQVQEIRFSGFYYPEILQDLLVWKRRNVPELTDEDPHEPTIQLLRAFAAGFHNANMLLDFVALETLITTARLRESLRGHLALIGYELHQPIPATVDLVFKLASPLTSTAVLPAGATASTVSTDTAPAMAYEVQEAQTVPRTDQLTQAWELDGGVWIDRTASLNGTGPAFTLWGGAPQAGDMLYLCHERALWDQIMLEGTDVHMPGVPAVIEYFDGGVDDTNPDLVDTGVPGQLTLRIDSMVGSSDVHGLIVRVRCLLTGVYADVASTWAGGHNVVVVPSLLGQTVPASSRPIDYVIGSEWKQPEAGNLVVNSLMQVGVSMPLPESARRHWLRTVVNGVEGYWLRVRVPNNGADSLTLSRITIHEGGQYLKAQAVQGTTEEDDPLGVSTGLADQQYSSSRAGVIDGTPQVYVDEGSGWVRWQEVPDFLAALSTSRVYTLAYDSDGRALITFGNSTAGRVPLLGANIKLVYRVGADSDGNVGANQIVVNSSGLSLVRQVWNPRSASGWEPAEGSTAEDLAQLKIRGPASLRTLERALTADDMEELAQKWQAGSGEKPIKRAHAREEVYGPKTVQVLVVGGDGAAVLADYLPELEVYFNGDPVEGTSGVGVLNTEATVDQYTQHVINVQVSITGGNAALVEEAIRAYLHPLLVDADGGWEHDFGGTVYRSRMIAAAHDADSTLVAIAIVAPAADVVLGPTELPVAGTFAVV